MTYKPKFHCRRQSGMNFGSVTENGVNSNLNGNKTQKKVTNDIEIDACM